MKPQIGKRKLKPSGIDWIGDVPEGRGVQRVGLCFRRHGSGTTPASTNSAYYEGENNWVQSGDLHGDAIYKTEKQLSDSALQEYSLTVYKAPFIAVAMYGASIANTSKVMIDACTNQACCVLYEPEEDFDLDYCFYAIRAARRVLIEAGRGGGQPNINRDVVRKLKIPIPSFDEQKRIAAKLDRLCGRVDELAANLTKEIAALQDYRKSLITECVTKGLNPKTKMKHSGIDWIGDMPEGWRILRVGLCFRRHGSGTTPSSDNLTYYEGENNWVQSGDLHGDAVYKTEKHLSDAALQECALTVYKAPFIAVAMYGASIANTSKVMIDACTNQACCVLCEPEDDIELEYCFYAIKAARKVLIEAGRGGGQPNINRDIVRKLKIPVPTVMEQREIAAYLDKHCAVIDAKIAERQRQLEKLAEYRASAIYEYVTGKKEVAA